MKANYYYDLTDLGYLYHGPATPPTYSIEVGPWKIIEIPKDVSEEQAKKRIVDFIRNIVAFELPTSLICNLRCKYCYIDDPRMKSKKLDPQIFIDILENLKKLFPVFQDPNSEEVFLTPWGAEPLCDLDTLEAVADWGISNCGSKFKTSTSTNGTIWNDRVERIFEKLLKHNSLQELQISLDGPKWVQDKYRPFAGGKGSFDTVSAFTKEFADLCHKLGHSTKYHFCSTIHLNDDQFVEAWVAAAEFFTEPNTWHFQPHMPMRVSALNFTSSENCEKFVEAQRETHNLMKRRIQQGIFCCDFYTNKLFFSCSNKSRNSFVYCSAMNSQIGIDIDGSIYPCHGPITSPWQKPFMWMGNVFEGVISYQKVIRNLSWMYNVYARAKCTTCPLYYYCLGNVCWSCPTHNIAATGEPSIDYIQKCAVYCECFKYWYANACMIGKGEVVDRVPRNEWFTEGIDYDNLPQLPDEQKVDPLRCWDGHFSWTYDGHVMHGVRRFLGYEPSHEIYVCGEWWQMFNYFNECAKEES